MKLLSLQRLGGIAVVLGALALGLYTVLFTALLPTNQIHKDFSLLVLAPHWKAIAGIAFLGIILSMLGFTAVYSMIYSESGIIGLLGYLSIQIAYILQACSITWEIFIYPVIAENAGAVAILKEGVFIHHPLIMIFRYLSMFSILAGIILFCHALVRSRVFPKSAGILVFIGALMYGAAPLFLLKMVGIIILAIGSLILGIKMFKE